MQREVADSTQSNDINWSLSILHINIRGFAKNSAELAAVIRDLDEKPCIILVNETHQPKGLNPELPGYTLVDRRDRRDFGEPLENDGGIAVLVLSNLDRIISLAHKSKDAERMWFCVNTDTTRLLLCCWYRRPHNGEVESIISLEKEYLSLAQGYNHVRTIRFGPGYSPRS